MALAGYRIVQEALTNVHKHAGPSRAEVIVGYEADLLRIRAGDDGANPRGAAATVTD